MKIGQYIQSRWLERLGRTGVLVVYDPARRYRDLSLSLRSEQREVVDAGEPRGIRGRPQLTRHAVRPPFVGKVRSSDALFFRRGSAVASSPPRSRLSLVPPLVKRRPDSAGVVRELRVHRRELGPPAAVRHSGNSEPSADHLKGEDAVNLAKDAIALQRRGRHRQCDWPAAGSLCKPSEDCLRFVVGHRLDIYSARLNLRHRRRSARGRL